MKITIKGEIPSKKNSKQIWRTKSGKPRVVSSDKYRAWEEEKVWELKSEAKGRKFVKVEKIEIDIFFGTKRRADLSNKIEGLMDVIVLAGVIEDDSWQIVPHLEVRGEYDKDNPRTEIRIYGR